MQIKLLVISLVIGALSVVGLDALYNRELDRVYKHNVHLFEQFCAWGRGPSK